MDARSIATSFHLRRLMLSATVVSAVAATHAQTLDARIDERVTGNADTTFVQLLEQIAWLRANESELHAALVDRIRGDQEELWVRVDKLLDQLADPRWLAREEAERTLTEIGGRARSRIDARRQQAPIHEVALRCERILRSIDARGMAREEIELRRRQTIVTGARTLRRDPMLAAALATTVGHPEPALAEAAIHSLAAQGGVAEVPVLASAARGAEPDRRRAALCALAAIDADAARAALAEVLTAGPLDERDGLAVVATLHRTGKGAALLTKLRESGAAIASAAALAPAASPAAVTGLAFDVTAADGTAFRSDVTAIVDDLVSLARPIEGIAGITLPMAGARLERVPAPSAVEAPSGARRFFLHDGSSLVGTLGDGGGDGVLTVVTTSLGSRRIAKAALAGIAFDPQLPRLPFATPRGDRVVVRSGGARHGVVDAIDAMSIRMRGDDGTAEAIDAETITAVVFKRPERRAPETRRTAVTLADGSRVFGHVARAPLTAFAVHADALGLIEIDAAQIARIEIGVLGAGVGGTTVVADYGANRIVEIDADGRELFAIAEVLGPRDVECLDDGSLLVTEDSGSRVLILARSGAVLWSYAKGLRNPTDADLLPNGNVLIADTYGDRVIEVDRDGDIVWQFAGGIRPFDVDRLANGNTLIADFFKERVIEVDPSGRIVFEVRGMPNVLDADRLPNGNTLICLRAANKVVEVDRDGRVVHEIAGLDSPSDADRLPNGNTLVAEHGAVREIDPSGKTVWRRAVNWAVEANRY